jgi:hypothetical protein
VSALALLGCNAATFPINRTSDMNPALIQYFEEQADFVVLTVILNGQTTVSRDFIIQTLLETYNMGLQIGSKAIDPNTPIPAIPGAPASLDGGFIS